MEGARRDGRLPKIIVSVHMGGLPPEQEAIFQLAREYGVRIIEDAAHALGASAGGERVGNGRWSDITVFSFHPVKIITTGEGGMAVTNDDRLAARLRLLRTHGITRDPTIISRSDAVAAGYQEQIELGFNYRLTDLQAALGLSQLARADDFVARRRAAAERYPALLAGLPIVAQACPADSLNAYHLYIIRLTNPAHENLAIIEKLRSRGVGATLHYPAVHLQPYYRSLGFHEGMFPEAERFTRTALSIPLFASLSIESQRDVATALHDVLSA
jgi:dTDP-4-amino-4,6-dideoxygalactose transaminase